MTISSFLSRRQWGLVIVLVSIHAGLLAYSANVHSPNANEPAHLAAGVSHWEFRRFELYRVNPPLIRMVAAIPTCLTEHESNWSAFEQRPGARPVFIIGPDFMWANGYRSLWLTTYGRWACIPFCLFGLWFCFQWSRELFGSFSAGLLSMTLWCFSPMMIAHGSFFTPDAHAASMGLIAGYTFWRWLKQPSWVRCLLASVGLGLALATKTTWILLLILWPLIWVIMYATSKTRQTETSIMPSGPQLIVIQVLAVYFLNLTYTFDGCLIQLKEYQFVSQSLRGPTTEVVGNRFSGSWIGEIPLPFPEQYVLGIDVQKKDLDLHHKTYFRGKIYDHGFWYYYLYAMAIKIPIGTQIITFLAFISALFSPRQTSIRDQLLLLMPSALIFIAVSSQTTWNGHSRYVLGAIPFLFVFAGQLVTTKMYQQRWCKAICVIALTWSIGSCLSSYPHSLSYFNEFIGGPKNGHKHLANSEIDWGQDLLFLKLYLDKHPEIEAVQLAYYGLLDPAIVGIRYTNPLYRDTHKSNRAIAPINSKDDLIILRAISVNFLSGLNFFQWSGQGRQGPFAPIQDYGREEFGDIQHVIGGSIAVKTFPLKIIKE